MSAKGYWVAFLVGVSAGATVALLYAPDSGVRTRRRIGKSIDDGVDYLEDAADYLREQAETLSKQAQTALKRTRSQVDDAIDSVTGAAKTAAKGVQALM